MRFSRTFEPNPDDGRPSAKLSQALQDLIGGWAQQSGNHAEAAVEAARAEVRARQDGRRTEAELKRQFAREQKDRVAETLAEARDRLRHTEPRIARPEAGRRVGFFGWAEVLLTFGILAGLIWIENSAASQALVSTGAFDVENVNEARGQMLTPVIVGIVLVAAIKFLSPALRRRIIQAAALLLVAVFLVWACCFAFQAELFRYDASAGFGLGAGAAEAEAQPQAGDASTAGGVTAWLMFGCLVISMALTAFLGHAAVEHQLRRHENWVLNPDYARALDDVQSHTVDLRVAEADIVQAERRYAALLAEEEQAAAQARALYKYLKQRATLWGWLLLFGLTAAGGCAGPAAAPGTGGLKSWSEPSARAPAAVTRVLAVSPVLPPAEKSVVRQQLDLELAWLADEAPIGSQLVVVDGLECAPVARFEAVPGVARIRKKSFVKPLAALREFFDKSRPRQKDDGRLHLPRLAQTAGQWHLPAGSRLIVCGNPLFLNEGKDAFFSMQGGRVPSDGCLFEDPRDNLYSVVGREKSLAGVYVHMGWGDDRVFEDDSARQAVQEFWAKYFSAMSATLVTAQPSAAEAFAAARYGVIEPLPHGEPDTDAEAAMVRTIKVPIDKREQGPPGDDEAEQRAGQKSQPSS
ncbi:MAG: hypothetical protein J0M17_22990, partial [Planctomycetes bacterium]|nr:hypothetical protein [Planctomycetota bacterium]